MEGSSEQDLLRRVPTIHVISDSVGMTAQQVARAAVAQFGVKHPRIEVLAKAKDFETIRSFLEEHAEFHHAKLGSDRLLVFYTLVDRVLARKVGTYIKEHPNILGVDLLSEPIHAIAELSGLKPTSKPGILRVADDSYFKRISALEFTINHDDGRNPQDLTEADIVLIGVSRSSKTPLSVFLAQQGLKVANVPLDPHTDPPREIFDVERTRLFGLMTSAENLIDIRSRRLGRSAAVAARYADPEYIYEDLDAARALMRRLGCIVVHTEKRAVEETAQEILRYYERSHPLSTDIIE